MKIAGNRYTANPLLEGPIARTLVRMALPMAFGMAALILFNVVDTLYVGRLGATQLAAMSFTFPVVYMLMHVAVGLGIGLVAVVSRVIGEGDHQRVRRLTSDGLILANTVVIVLAVAGLLSIDPLYRALGAGDDLVSMIKSYMVWLYGGVGFLVIPIMGNSAIRATGDTKTPAIIMAVAGVVNIALDPLLIFGIGPFPRLGFDAAGGVNVSYLLRLQNDRVAIGGGRGREVEGTRLGQVMFLDGCPGFGQGQGRVGPAHLLKKLYGRRRLDPTGFERGQIGHHLARRPLGHNPALLHEPDLVGLLGRFRLVVNDEQRSILLAQHVSHRQNFLPA